MQNRHLDLSTLPGIADAGMGEEGDSGVERLARGALGRHIRPERGGGNQSGNIKFD